LDYRCDKWVTNPNPLFRYIIRSWVNQATELPCDYLTSGWRLTLSPELTLIFKVISSISKSIFIENTIFLSRSHEPCIDTNILMIYQENSIFWSTRQRDILKKKLKKKPELI
jgi:hypothetical protein